MHTNRLVHEKSPYLLQHAHNPVDWRPWSDEAFDAARAEDKPVFLSIGYSTCHWCHVMERESFESETIAGILNRHFISIKVDREERPDVDRIYMMFVQATTGGGGWPMSVWLTPDRKPFYGGTYFPPDSRYGRPGFAQVLEHIAEAWKTRRAQLVESADSMLAQLGKHAQVIPGAFGPQSTASDACFHYFRRTFDSKLGGFGQAPKFPRPSALNFLFRYHAASGNQEAADMALLTLREMALGGMNDQLGGGFHRYSVDERWFVPHFEKMLYDQAQLAISYLEAFQTTHETFYADVARQVFEYVLRDMTHSGGAFYSAEDADSAADPSKPHDKGEGAFYIWAYDELERLLGADRAAVFARAYGCEREGNVSHDPHGEFTGRNILAARDERAFNDEGLDECRRILLAARAGRPRPHLDDKILTAWNGLMISAFARGAQALEPFAPHVAARYRNAALRASQFVLDNLHEPDSNTLWRRWRDGDRAIEGMLDDYAFFAQAQIDLYETTFDTSHLVLAQRLTAAMLDRFEDKEHGGFYSSSAGSADLILRVKEDYDGAEPSGNSVAAMNLLRLTAYTGNGDLDETAQDSLRAFASRINEQSPTVPQMMCALLWSLAPKSQIVVAGSLEDDSARALLHEVRSRFRPFTTVFALSGGENLARLADWAPQTGSMGVVDGRPAAYVCENFTCKAPVTDPKALGELLD
jgi:hypothetical protein